MRIDVLVRPVLEGGAPDLRADPARVVIALKPGQGDGQIIFTPERATGATSWIVPSAVKWIGLAAFSGDGQIIYWISSGYQLEPGDRLTLVINP